MTIGAALPHEIAATPADGGVRLDRFLASRLEGLSRARVQSLIRDGHVSSAGRTLGDPGQRVKPGESFMVSVPAPVAATPAGEAIALAVVYEDAHLVVIDKPAGLVVHPAAGHATGTLVNALIAHCGESLSGIGGVRRPGIVHRLDKDTSGLLVVAKSDAAHQGLSAQFAAHGRDGRLSRRYEAVVWGAPERARGLVDAPLARSNIARTKMAVSRSETARPAVTHYETRTVFDAAGGKPGVAAHLALELETGRTHQIRVHMAHIGHPLLGDQVYGAGFKTSASRLTADARAALDALGRQALHAARLGFEHPLTGRRLEFESPLPADLARLIEALSGTPPERLAQKSAARKRPRRGEA